jgi:hypothetical protein
MEESLKVLDIVATFIAGGALIWAIKLVKTLKEGINAQKAIIDSFKAQSDYVGNVQSTLSKLYDPQEIENIVNVKVSEKAAKLSKSRENLEKGYEKTVSSIYRLSSWAATSLPDKEFESALSIISVNESEEMIEFLKDLRIKYPNYPKSISGGIPQVLGGVQSNT